MTQSVCSPLLISHALYSTVPAANQCTLLLIRDAVTGLLLIGSAALAWRTANVHNAEFATFLFVLCLMASLLWSELLALAVVNYAVYQVIAATAYACAWIFDKKSAENREKSFPRSTSIRQNDPANIRIQL